MKNFMLFLLIFVPATVCAASDRFSAMLETAENAFIEGDYRKTIEIYEALIQVEKINDPYLYYNLSNAYYRNAETGKAVVNIERAYLLKPRDKDIRHNRNFFASATGSPRESSFDGIYDKVINICSLNAMTVITAFLFLLPLVLSVLFFATKKTAFKKMALILPVFVAVSSIITALKVKNEIIDTAAVILKDAEVRSGPGVNNPGLFKLAQGRIVRAERAGGGWTFITVKPEKISGWTESANLENING